MLFQPSQPLTDSVPGLRVCKGVSVNAEAAETPKTSPHRDGAAAILPFRAGSRASAPRGVQCWALAMRRPRVIFYQIAKSGVQENHELSPVSADISGGVSANPQVEN